MNGHSLKISKSLGLKIGELSDWKMADKIFSLETQIKCLENSMVTIGKAVKEIGAVVNKVEQKENKSESKKIEAILQTQTNLGETSSANTKAIERIDDEIFKIQSFTPTYLKSKQCGPRSNCTVLTLKTYTRKSNFFREDILLSLVVIVLSFKCLKLNIFFLLCSFI